MSDPLNIDPVRQQYNWYAEREKFRQANRQRIRKLLKPVMVPYRWSKLAIWAICEHGKLILRNEWRFTLYKKSERFLTDGSKHGMEDSPEPISIPGNELAERVSKQAHDSVLLDSVTIPGGEDYDAPPIYDLENEDELLAWSEAIVKCNQSELEDGHTKTNNKLNP